MKCPFCGQEHPDTTKFCPETGNKIEKSSLKCPQCGRTGIPLGSNFCPDCRFCFNENYASVDAKSELIEHTPQNNSQIVDIKKLNIEECERFLKINPNHPQTEAIRKKILQSKKTPTFVGNSKTREKKDLPRQVESPKKQETKSKTPQSISVKSSSSHSTSSSSDSGWLDNLLDKGSTVFYGIAAIAFWISIILGLRSC